jgi:hypothetical protein
MFYSQRSQRGYPYPPRWRVEPKEPEPKEPEPARDLASIEQRVKDLVQEVDALKKTIKK